MALRPIRTLPGRAWRSFVGLLRDLFMGHGNWFWDLGRIITGAFAGLMMMATVWNIYLGKEIDLGPNGLGGGIAAVLTAGAALLYLKDKMHLKNVNAEKDATHEEPA